MNETTLIYRPERQPSMQRILFGMATAAIWIAFAYLWLPLATLLMWLLGLKSAYLELYLHQNQMEPFLLLLLPAIALGVTASLIGWAEYNRRRFRNTRRRGRLADIPAPAIATALGASPQIAQTVRQSRCTVLRMSDQAHPLSAEALPGLSATIIAWPQQDRTDPTCPERRSNRHGPPSELKHAFP